MPLRYTTVTITTGRPMTEPDTFCSQSHTVSRNIPPAIHTLRKASKAHALAESLSYRSFARSAPPQIITPLDLSPILFLIEFTLLDQPVRY